MPTKINEQVGIVAFTPELEAGTPNWKLTVKTGSTATQIDIDTGSSATHNAALIGVASDFFKGATLYFMESSTTCGGTYRTISASSYSAGTASFTVPAFGATPTAADVVAIFYSLPASPFNPSLDTQNLTRDDFKTPFLDPLASVKGLKSGSGSFDFEITGLSQELGNGDTPEIDYIAKFLECYGTRRAVAGNTVASLWGSTTSGDLTSASAYEVGDYIMINNEIRRITIIATNTITVSPAFSAAPAASDELFFVEAWTPLDTGHRTHTILSQTDTRLEEMTGCAFSVKEGGAFGEFLKGTADFDISSWSLYDKATDNIEITGDLPTKTPPEFRTTAAVVFGSTDLCASSFEFDAGYERKQIKDTCTGNLFEVRNRAATLAVTFRDTSKTPKETWQNSGTKDYAIAVAGSTPGNIVGAAGYSQIQDTTTSENIEDTRYHGATFGFIYDGTTTGIGKPKILRA